MRRESHVRICEGVGVRSPRATRLVTVDTMLGKRFYVFAVISHKTREIIQFAMTENPTREFVRHQLMFLSETIACKAYLIHDPALRDVDVQHRLIGVHPGSSQNGR